MSPQRIPVIAAVAFIAAIVVSGLAGGCSSIPDVVFSDDAATSSSGSTSSGDGGGGGDGSADEFACPDKPPPEGRGVCCGDQLCLRCNRTQCERCDRENCDAPEVCCARNGGGGGGSMDCRRPSFCN